MAERFGSCFEAGVWRGTCERHQPGVSHQAKVVAAHAAPDAPPEGGVEAGSGDEDPGCGSGSETRDGSTATAPGCAAGAGSSAVPPSRTHARAQLRGGTRHSLPNRAGRGKGGPKRGRSPSSSASGEDALPQVPPGAGAAGPGGSGGGSSEGGEAPEGGGSSQGAPPAVEGQGASPAAPAAGKAPSKRRKAAKAVSSAQRERLLKKPRAPRTKVPDKYRVVGRACQAQLVITTYIAVGHDGIHRLLQRIEISRLGSHDHGDTPVGSPEDQQALNMWPYPTVAHYLQEVSCHRSP